MITDLAPLTTADLPAQPFRVGSAVPLPDIRADLLRLRCDIADLPALGATLSRGGPRVRVETAVEGSWPGRIDVAELVAGGVVELALQLPDQLDADSWVKLVGLLVGAREHGLPVEWPLPTDAPEWADHTVLHHLQPPSAGADTQVRAWRGAHRFGQLYWRRGPGFVTVVDARAESRIRYVIDETPLLEAFGALIEASPIESVPAQQLDELLDAGLAVRGDALAVGLAYRLRHTPMPGYQV